MVDDFGPILTGSSGSVVSEQRSISPDWANVPIEPVGLYAWTGPGGRTMR